MREKMKENEKMNNHLILVRDLKRLWNMKATVLPMLVGALGTDHRGLAMRVEEL